MLGRFAAIVLFIQIVTAATVVSQQKNTVDLGYAKYQGAFNSTTNVTSFRGIRYAAPPTGNLRWQAPKAPAHVSDVQSANTQPEACYQSGIKITPGSLFSINVTENEDCLFLNVFVPGNVTKSSSLPVVVWVHGGGYVAGSAAGDGGDFIRDADGGVISVVIQYRLGLFGFLPGSQVKEHGALNAGLLDQRFAFQWVQDHISSFGGDPSKVTIWGESAGAGSVLQHVVANGGHTKPPLFRAAMTSSTFVPNQYKYNDPIPEKLYADVVEMSKCNTHHDTLSCLRSVDIKSLQDVNTEISMRGPLTPSGVFAKFFWDPVVDGSFIVERPVETLLKGKVNGEVLLAVTNTFEGLIFVNSSTVVNISNYVESLFPNFGPEQINATVAQYANAGLSTNMDKAIAILGESNFICPTYFLVEAFGARGYKGEFAIPPGVHGEDLGEYFPSFFAPVTSNTTFIKSFSQSFLAVVKSLDPNSKFDPADITPRWNPWAYGNTEMLFNVTAGDAVVHPISTDSGLIGRCKFWQKMAPFTPQ